jgi:hypothetical protein
MADEPTISFAGYTFLESKGCFACIHVLRGDPVRLYVHELDGSLQFLCGAGGHGDDDYAWVHAEHILANNRDMVDMPAVNFGFEAERDGVGKPWVVRQTPDE